MCVWVCVNLKLPDFFPPAGLNQSHVCVSILSRFTVLMRTEPSLGCRDTSVAVFGFMSIWCFTTHLMKRSQQPSFISHHSTVTYPGSSDTVEPLPAARRGTIGRWASEAVSGLKTLETPWEREDRSKQVIRQDWDACVLIATCAFICQGNWVKRPQPSS